MSGPRKTNGVLHPVSELRLVPGTRRPGRARPPTAPIFDLVAFGRALAVGDAADLLGHYATDADLRVMADEQPPVPVLVLCGRETIASWMARSDWPDLDREVFHLVDGGDRIAFTQRWSHVDGTATCLTSTAELRDGLITVQHTIRARR